MSWHDNVSGFSVAHFVGPAVPIAHARRGHPDGVGDLIPGGGAQVEDLGLSSTASGSPTLRDVSGTVESVGSVRAAARLCQVSPGVISRWIAAGRIGSPPWTEAELQNALEAADRSRLRRRSIQHGTASGWTAGCDCEHCAAAHAEARRKATRAAARAAVPSEVRDHFLALLEEGWPFAEVCQTVGLTAERVWTLARLDHDWAKQLDEVLMATRRPDLVHGRARDYLKGCRCPECRHANRVRLKRVAAEPAKSWAEDAVIYGDPPAATVCVRCDEPICHEQAAGKVPGIDCRGWAHSACLPPN